MGRSPWGRRRTARADRPRNAALPNRHCSSESRRRWPRARITQRGVQELRGCLAIGRAVPARTREERESLACLRGQESELVAARVCLDRGFELGDAVHQVRGLVVSLLLGNCRAERWSLLAIDELKLAFARGLVNRPRRLLSDTHECAPSEPALYYSRSSSSKLKRCSASSRSSTCAVAASSTAARAGAPRLRAWWSAASRCAASR